MDVFTRGYWIINTSQIKNMIQIYKKFFPNSKITHSYYLWLYLLLLTFIPICLFINVSKVNGQTPTPTPTSREIIILQIKSYAERHEKNNSPLMTQMIIQLFHNNSVGLSDKDVAQIYEEEYCRLEEAQKSDTWNQLTPSMGWIVAGILSLIILIGNFIKEKMLGFFNSLWVCFYNKLSGSFLLRMVALSHYRKTLINRYGKLIIPFRPEHPLDIQKIYIPIKIEGSSENSLLDAHVVIEKYQRIVIIGEPGSGKTMLLKHILIKYALGELNLMSKKTIAVLLELHRLNDQNLNIEQLLVDEFTRNNFPNSKIFIEKSLENGSLLLLFDGLDEVNNITRNRVIQNIKDFIEKYYKCYFILTCRSAIYREEFADEINRKFETVEFSDHQIHDFLQSWERDMIPKGKSSEQLMLTLQDRPRIMALARNPLMLTIITFLYSDADFVLPHSRTDFYRQATDFLLGLWHKERNLYRSSDKRLVLQHLALGFQDKYQENADRRIMNLVEILKQIRDLLPSLNLQPDIDARPLIDEIIERSGLMISIDSGEYFQFAHLTLQEYFAAVELMDKSTELINRFSKDFDTWRETVKLWCGLEINCTLLINQIYKMNPVIAFECLADAQKVDQTIADKIINEFENNFDNMEENQKIYQAFAAVASVDRPLGRNVYNFLKEKLLNGFSIKVRTSAAHSLYLTNLPEAANLLSTQYNSLPKVREYLVRMGDLSIEYLISLVKKGSIEAIDDIYMIKTPKAVESLIPFLWENNKQIASYVAWRIAAMLSVSNLEITFKKYKLPEFQKRTSSFDWIWRPFMDSTNSDLPIIIDRVSFLICHTSEDNIPLIPLPLDPRLVTPICVYLSDFEINKLNLYENPPSYLLELFDTLDINQFTKREIKYSEQNIQQRKIIIFQILESYGNTNNKKDIYNLTQFLFQIINSIASPRLIYLLNCLNFEQRYRLIKEIIIENPKPKIEDWINIFNPLKYEFRKSWHFQALRIIMVLLIILIYTPIIIFFENSTNWSNGLILMGGISIFSYLPLYWNLMSIFTDNDHIFPIILLLSTIIPVPIIFLLFFSSFTIIYLPLNNYFQWQNILLSMLLSIGISIILWRRGKYLERIVNNPLKGFLSLDDK